MLNYLSANNKSPLSRGVYQSTEIANTITLPVNTLIKMSDYATKTPSTPITITANYPAPYPVSSKPTRKSTAIASHRKSLLALPFLLLFLLFLVLLPVPTSANPFLIAHICRQNCELHFNACVAGAASESLLYLRFGLIGKGGMICRGGRLDPEWSDGEGLKDIADIIVMPYRIAVCIAVRQSCIISC